MSEFNMSPLFSVGITTFNRKNLLKECLASILNQQVKEIEIIIGNDYQAEPLSQEILGINDSRVKIINYPKNIGPIKNAQELFKQSNGEYFCWMADDDAFAPEFFQIMKKNILMFSRPEVIFPKCISGTKPPTHYKINEEIAKAIKINDFLNLYIQKKLHVIGCYGIFRRDFLTKIGTMEQLGTGIHSPYADNLLIIKTAVLERVFYLDTPLVFFRVHSSSSSQSRTDIQNFSKAQQEFVEKSLFYLQNRTLDKNEFTFHLLTWVAQNFYAVLGREKIPNIKELFLFIIYLYSFRHALKKRRVRFIKILIKQTAVLLKTSLKKIFTFGAIRSSAN